MIITKPESQFQKETQTKYVQSSKLRLAMLDQAESQL